MSDFSDILDKIDQIDLDSQSQLVDIINKRYNYQRREFFIKETLASIIEIENGDYQIGNSDDLFKEFAPNNQVAYNF